MSLKDKIVSFPVWIKFNTDLEYKKDWIKCEDCEGRGHIGGVCECCGAICEECHSQCEICEGTGYINHPVVVYRRQKARDLKLIEKIEGEKQLC